MIIKTERRAGVERREANDPFAPDRRGDDRRTMCWEVENCGRRGVPLGYSKPRRHHCPHFFLTHADKGRVPIQAPQLMKTLMKQEGTVARCELRGGVHLDSGYVNDLCLTGQFNDCVFYEDAAD